jgi:hypothetical protein
MTTYLSLSGMLLKLLATAGLLVLASATMCLLSAIGLKPA